MSPFFCRMAVSASLLRSTAIVTLLGVPFLIGQLTMAHAESAAPPAVQLPQTMPPQAGVEASDSRAETVEQRIASLHTALRITPEQESKWESVAGAMRENATAMQKLFTESNARASQSMTAVEDLKSYEKFTQAHADGLKNLIDDFEGLYKSMPDSQKKIADQVFQSFGSKGVPSHN
ncbi:MAG: Spy/CpxP family protein refolding chaperone [Rhodospirillaceae bacterium]